MQEGYAYVRKVEKTILNMTSFLPCPATCASCSRTDCTRSSFCAPLVIVNFALERTVVVTLAAAAGPVSDDSGRGVRGDGGGGGGESVVREDIDASMVHFTVRVSISSWLLEKLWYC